MKKNYRNGIMKRDNIGDEITKFKTESLEEISRLPYFESDGESGGSVSAFENDGIIAENDK